MNETLEKHASKVAVGGVGVSAILFGLLQMQAGEIHGLREQNYVLVQRIVVLEVRQIYDRGFPGADEQAEIMAKLAKTPKLPKD